MIKPVSREELSALLDHELPSARVSEIDFALADDPVLDAEYQRLADLDRSWSEAAKQARFPFSVELQPGFQWVGSTYGMGVLLALLIGIQLIVKSNISTSLAVAIHAIALGTLLFAIIRLVLRSEAGHLGIGI
jgi:anti-sigma factor RsiW